MRERALTRAWLGGRTSCGVCICVGLVLLLASGLAVCHRVPQSRDALTGGLLPRRVAWGPSASREALEVAGPCGSEPEVQARAAQVAGVAYLLFGAALPLRMAKDFTGLSSALLPLLSPEVLRLYVSRDDLCSAPHVEGLVRLSRELYGMGAMREACHYPLYTALRDTFGWARHNALLPLDWRALGSAASSAALGGKFPDGMEAAVAEALGGGEGSLRSIAESLRVACGWETSDYAPLVPRIAEVLGGLQSDLETLRELGASLEVRYGTAAAEGDGTEAAVEAAARGAAVERDPSSDGARGWRAERRVARGTWPDNYFYDMPKDFQPADPSTLPQLYIPLVIHILTFQDGPDGLETGPVGWDQSPSHVDRLIRVLNALSRPTNMTFFLQDLRYNPDTYPELLMYDSIAWQAAFNCSDERALTTKSRCEFNSSFVPSAVWDWPRSMNIFVSGISRGTGGAAGRTFSPGSFLDPGKGYVWIAWDMVSTDSSNSLLGYNSGPQILLHELFHMFGVAHSFGPNNDVFPSCQDDDYVSDTPVARNSVIFNLNFQITATTFCQDLFWNKYGGDWNATYKRLSTTLGIPPDDQNAWADTCPGFPGYDELGNYMTYTPSVCFMALGHFTLGQVQRAHRIASDINPVLYAWGQYYASHREGLPPMLEPPLEQAPDPCKTTATGKCVMSICDPGLRNALPPPYPPHPPSPPPPPPAPAHKPIPEECKFALPGCLCQSVWRDGGDYDHGSSYNRYCANPNNDPQGLWCELDPSCPDFDPSNPYMYCDPNLTLEYCGTGEPVLYGKKLTPFPPEAPPFPPAPSPRGTVPSNYLYDMPPSFQPADPSILPQLYVPLVVQVLTYQDGPNGKIGPYDWDQAPAYVDRLIRVVNAMSRPTNITFFLQELRYLPAQNPGLLLPNYTAWQAASDCKQGTGCLRWPFYLEPLVVDWPRSINVFVSGELGAISPEALGFAFGPGSARASQGFISLQWSLLSGTGHGFNSLAAYNFGPATVVHELFHHLGLRHTFGPTNGMNDSCLDDDYVSDTPTSWGGVGSRPKDSSVSDVAARFCKNLFWNKYGGDWNATYKRLSTTLGIPPDDQNAWADSCPGRPGYDELGNYMTYSPYNCPAALGHFTLGQVKLAHLMTNAGNPVLYAWGQYYASHREGLPPMLEPPLEQAPDPCKVMTMTGCACKRHWVDNGTSYSYCRRLPGGDPLYVT
ncbi:hypothetical protein HYH03_000186 [Edaphochlamys debaryana]|uniref:Peptidase M43 pregnancy-associated plasma-A domain-containing protein n=1 Tax=Edaphochlamys debaryana TaxID=47281 RepID=A0A836C766_9CHLO|nr:hypothetical protein HYH03_000186 [Edaphochlamys debaryana]|eukprot:KAG2501684.1 hypothetical protein HYH03_000186 [Edaphochlamys debaryana]